MKHDARIHAQNLWNSLACGELSGDKSTVDYFLAVERDRLPQIGWAKDYFDYKSFADKKVLEIGIGQGTDLMQFARAGAECHGVDITDNHLELTARNFRLQGKVVDLRKADATKLPFPDNTFDCVYSLGVIHHIPEADRVLAEVFRVLKPGGKVMLALYHKWSAYHLKLLIVQGVLKGHLLRAGYDGLLARIEEAADGKNFKPYVKLYSRRDMRRLLKSFRIDDLSVHQFYADHLLPTGLVKPLLNKPLPLSRLFGWYVACHAVKVK